MLALRSESYRYWHLACTSERGVQPAQSLLGEPNNDSPLNVQAAQMWDDQEAFRKVVHSRSGTGGKQ